MLGAETWDVWRLSLNYFENLGERKKVYSFINALLDWILITEQVIDPVVILNVLIYNMLSLSTTPSPSPHIQSP